MYLASGGTLDWTLGVAGIPYRWTSKCVLASGIRFNSILIVYGHSRLFWWCCVIQGRAGSSLAFVILDLFGHQHKHQFDICFSYGMELPDTGMWGFLLPPNQIIPTGQSVNKLIQQQITTISVQNMFSVSSVEFTTFQCHQEAPLIHGILLKRDDFLSGMGIPPDSGKAVDSRIWLKTLRGGWPRLTTGLSVTGIFG